AQYVRTGPRVPPLPREMAGTADHARGGLSQARHAPPLSGAVLPDVQIRQMGDHQAVELLREVLEPGLMARDLDPVRLDDPGVDEKQLGQGEDEDESAADP